MMPWDLKVKRPTKFNIKTLTTTTSTMVNCRWEISRKSTILGWKCLVTKDHTNTIKFLSRVDSRTLLKVAVTAGTSPGRYSGLGVR